MEEITSPYLIDMHFEYWWVNFVEMVESPFLVSCILMFVELFAQHIPFLDQ